MPTVKSVQEVAFHRNGVSGQGFYAILFTADVEPDDGKFSGREPSVGVKDAKWFAAVTDEPGEVYVVCLDLIPTCGVRFAGGNSWRGDRFEAELRAAIANPPDSGGAIRCGPFAIPLGPDDEPVGMGGQAK